jgi:hypothetical protein
MFFMGKNLLLHSLDSKSKVANEVVSPGLSHRVKLPLHED